jgi:hypothetical protein
LEKKVHVMSQTERVLDEGKKCLFCLRTDVKFGTVEHIIPESLGNTTDVLEGLVCDACQNYLAREVERAALEKTPIAFWRTFLGTTTKRGKLPAVDLTPPEGGRLAATHPLTDVLGITSHADGSTSVDISDPSLARGIRADSRTQFRLVLSPFHLSVLARFIGKMGLEFLAMHELKTALEREYDPLRAFVRQGSTSRLWALYWGTQGEISDLRGFSCVENGCFEEHECYRYGLGKTEGGGHVFVFGIGTDLWLISLGDRLPEHEFESFIEGVPLTCVFYPDGSW